MEYSEYIKYGIKHIKNGEVVLDDVSDGVHTLSEYRDLYFKQLILLSKKKIDEIARDTLFTAITPNNLVDVKNCPVNGIDRWVFSFGKNVYAIPEHLTEDFINLSKYQEEKFKAVTYDN